MPDGLMGQGAFWLEITCPAFPELNRHGAA